MVFNGERACGRETSSFATCLREGTEEGFMGRTENGGGEVHVAAVACAAGDGLVEVHEQPERVELPHERHGQADDRPRPAKTPSSLLRRITPLARRLV